jgi:hypothetical protein
MNAARLVCESIHRAIRFAGLKLLQTFQLYRPVELQGWLALHQLYALAEGQQLCELTVADELYGDGTITACYLHALILGCCKPNQLRQGDLAAIYRGLQDWSTLVQIEQSNGRKSLFLVDLDSDRPPLYSSLYHEPPGPRTRYIDTEPLLRHLTKLAANSDKQGVIFDKDSIISPSLLTHLVTAFGSMSMRNFTRKKGNKPMWIGLGLSACHYYLAGEKTFLQVLHGDDYIPELNERLSTNPFLERHNDGDVWQRSNPEEDFASPDYADGESEFAHQISVDRETLAKLENLDAGEIPEEERYAAHKVTMFDASPGGYCLEWTAQLPGDIKTGDIVCIREDDSSRWTVAVIRWLSRAETGKTLIGLELLSPGGKPCGARMQLQKKGEESEPMRALLLPEIKLVGQPHTLITPRSGFRERQKIILSRKGEEFYVQLLRQVAVTGSFVQFEFRYIKQLGEVLAEDKSRPRDSSYDSLWSNI